LLRAWISSSQPLQEPASIWRMARLRLGDDTGQ
jgi:hypothetical protein